MREILQEVQDLLADFSGMPLCLFEWKILGSKEIDFVNPGITHIAGYSWSYNPSFFRILEEAPINKKAINALFSSISQQVVENEDFKPVVKQSGDHWGFGAVVSELKKGADGTRYRKPRYLLLGGPIHVAEPLGGWDLFKNELKHVRQEELDLAKRLQLTSEFFELPCRPSPGSLEDEAKYLQYTFNGVIRDIIPIVKNDPDSDLAKIPTLAIVLYELFRHVRNSDRYMKYLDFVYKVCKKTTGMIPASLAIGFRNPASNTGFMALYVPSYSGDYRRHQLIFIPDSQDVERMLWAASISDFGARLLGWIDIPQKAKEARIFNIPFEEGKQSLKGRLFLWFEKVHERRLNSWVNNFLQPFLEGTASSWGTTKERIVSRVMQTLSHHADRKHNEFTDAIAAFSLPSNSNLQKDEKEDFRKILTVTRQVIGSKSIIYYRPKLFKDPAVASPYAWSVSEDSVLSEDDLELSEEFFKTLFVDLNPIVTRGTGLNVFLPVISGNRTLGILKVTLDSEALFDHKLPLLVELSERLGLRIPYRRMVLFLHQFLHQLVSALGKEKLDLNDLAENIVFYFSESACSIWTYNHERKRFELQGRVGISFEDDRLNEFLSLEEAQDSLVFRCYQESGHILHVNLEEDTRVLARGELLDKGFKQGLALGMKSDKSWLGVVLWSRRPFIKDYYSRDDETFLRLSVFTTLQMLRLHDLLHRQRTLYDKVLTGLGHELRSPLANIEANIELLAKTRDKKFVRDLANITRYTRTLADMLIHLGKFAEVSTKEPSIGKASPCPLFEGIIYKAINTVRWRAEKKGIEICTRFDPQTFPSSLYLTEIQKEVMFSIIFNLLDNAIKYTPKKTRQPIEVLGEIESNFIVIRVRNFGIGVPEGEEEMIFEPFKRGSNAWRGHPVGSGLGLYLSRRFAEGLGGSLKLMRNAEPTEFSLYVPFRFSAAP